MDRSEDNPPYEPPAGTVLGDVATLTADKGDTDDGFFEGDPAPGLS